MKERVHEPVMMAEVVKYLQIDSGSRIIDATLNGGGHTRGILEKYPEVKILGVEYDPDIFAKFQLTEEAKRIIATNDSYVHIKEICQRYNFKPTGILFDLGVSSHHYENGRGFSFKGNEPLDMRFNPKIQGLTAADIVNGYGPEDLEQIISEYGEEAFAERIAKAIIHFRQIKPITTTEDLVEVINGAVPAGYKHRRIHPATKTFQALRMAVNDELSAIEEGLNAAIDVLEPQGRLVVISFHGLEDKKVRKVFKERVAREEIKWVTKDTIKPNWQEIKNNPRARSAKMKIAEKL